MDRSELGVFEKWQEGCLKGVVLGVPYATTMNKTDTCGLPQPSKAKFHAFVLHSLHVHP